MENALNKNVSNKLELSERLTALCRMVPKKSLVADVGCDHAFVPIYLVKTGICSHVLAMDVRKGPLLGAQLHIEEFGLESYIETRLSDGLKEYEKGEADTLICAGMGGRLMLKILFDAGDKLNDFKVMLLQPQSELYEFRRTLRRNKIAVTDENMVYEGGKYYFLMKAVYRADSETDMNGCIEDESGSKMQENIKLQELYDRYGEWNIRKKSPLLVQMLKERQKALKDIFESLSMGTGEKAKSRHDELEHEADCVKAVIKLLDE
jgi:tRNA (adenine22-N1)-methyltransferase